jgi:hypothetical protein
MAPASTNNSNNAATLDLILSSLAEVKTVVSGLDGRIRALEGAIITQSVTAAQRLDAAFSRIDEHTKQIADFRADLDCRVRERIEITDKLSERIGKLEVERLAQMEGRVSRLEWIAGVATGLSVLLAGLIVTLLWKIFTGEVQIK